MNFNLQSLSIFFEIARAGSFSGASKKLNITQPALSRTIKNLEEALDYKLFSRHPRGVKLTSEGTRAFEHCQRIFHECSSIKSLKVDHGKNLNIAASENLCLKILPKALSALVNLSDDQNVTCEFSSGTASEIIKNVTLGLSEIGYCFHSAKLMDYTFTPILDLAFVVVANPELIKEKKLTYRNLAQAPYIGSRLRDYHGSNLAKFLLRTLNEKITTSFQSNSQESQVQMAIEGLGFTLVPEFLVAEHLRRNKLRLIKTPKNFSGTLFRVTHSTKVMSAFETSFEEKMKSLLR